MRKKRYWMSEFVYRLYKDANESLNKLMSLLKDIDDC